VVALGPRGYGEMVVDVCERERPHVFVAHPPYDHLTVAVADRMRAAGTRVVAYAFDDEIFAPFYPPETLAELARLYDRYVTVREVRWAQKPMPAIPNVHQDIDVALVGRAYPRRRELVKALQAAGIRVNVRGAGWEGGPVSRADMLSLYARAAVVVTTADWEDVPVPMVKHRLLDTAMLGAFQIAQDAPDLRGYFPEGEVPAYGSTDELIVRIRGWLPRVEDRRRAAAAARGRALAEHTWARRFPQLIEGVAIREPDAPAERSLALDTTLRALASRAEGDGRIAAAAALWREVIARDPVDAAAAAGVGRCLRDLGDGAGAVPWLRRAMAAAGPAADALQAGFPRAGVGTGLGRLSRCPPAAEPLAFLIAVLVELGRIDEACAELDRTPPGPLALALAATLRGDDIPPAVATRLEKMR